MPVLTTPGSIGYVNLAEARTSGFAPATTTTFWVELLDRDKPNLHHRRCGTVDER